MVRRQLIRHFYAWRAMNRMNKEKEVRILEFVSLDICVFSSLVSDDYRMVDIVVLNN
jgi:hypothetical protein